MADGEHGTGSLHRHLSPATRPRLHPASWHTRRRPRHPARRRRLQRAALLALPASRDALSLAADEQQRHHGRATDATASLPLLLLLQGTHDRDVILAYSSLGLDNRSNKTTEQSQTTLIDYYSTPGGVAEYCDERGCLCVCLSVRQYVSGTTCPVFTNFVHVNVYS